MRLGDLGELVVMTLRDANSAMRALRGLDLPMAARWMALLLAIVLSRFLGVVLAAIYPPELEGPMVDLLANPAAMAGIEFAATVLTAFMVVQIGRLFGGTGNFPDAILVIAWIELILVAIQSVQVLLMTVVPASAVLMGLIAGILSIYLTITMTKALHGFRSAALVALAYFGVSLLVGLLLLQLLPQMFILPEVPQ